MQEFLATLLKAWQEKSADLPFLRARWQRLANIKPVETLNTTFYQMYCHHPALATYTLLRSFFFPQIPYIIDGLTTYTRYLNTSRNPGFDDQPEHLISREIRCLCREAILHTLTASQISQRDRSRLLGVLPLLQIKPGDYGKLTFNQAEVVANLAVYLAKARTLAELPQFLPLIFTTDELNCFQTPMSSCHFFQEEEVTLEKLLVPVRKKHTLQSLKYFMLTCPDQGYAKKAFAVYISLGELIPWTRHSFIKRLLLVSYQENRVLQITKNNREALPLC